MRGVAARGEYFHNGIARSLEEVVRFYEESLGFRFTRAERRDLVAFLRALESRGERTPRSSSWKGTESHATSRAARPSPARRRARARMSWRDPLQPRASSPLGVVRATAEGIGPAQSRTARGTERSFFVRCVHGWARRGCGTFVAGLILMQKISVVQEDAGVVGVLEEESSAALTVRLPDGHHVSVSRDQLEPLADGTLLLKTSVDQLEPIADESSRTTPVLASATIPIAGSIGATWQAETRSLEDGETVTIPRVEEQVQIDKQERLRGTVRVHVVPRQREQTVAVPVVETRAEVRRVEVGRIVDKAPDVREEGDTVIIPVVEEVLVVEKRLLLREEVHVTRKQTMRTEQHQVSLRSEHVEISRSEDELEQ